MYRVLDKQAISDTIKLMVIHAPHVAKKARAGQFIIIRIDETSERIPLTIADYDTKTGAIVLIFQEVGKSTMHLGSLNPGDNVSTFVGPLGHPTEIANFGTVVCVGGGVGIAPIYPIARALREAGNTVISIIGSRNKDLLLWEDKMRAVSDELHICTDDGSYGRKAFVTDALKDILEDNTRSIARVWAIGPAVMMRAVSNITKNFNVPTIVSLNTIMIDGTGMCGGCRVLLEDGAQFVCVDGPEFDGHKVDWSNLLSRLQFYREEEKTAVERYKHVCNLEKAITERGN